MLDVNTGAAATSAQSSAKDRQSSASPDHKNLSADATGALDMLAFQAADIYQVQAFRGYEKQYFRLASAWSVVFLIVISFTFFAKIGDHYSRLWLGAFYAAGLVTLLAFRRTVFVLVRHWTRQGRLDRRTVV